MNQKAIRYIIGLMLISLIGIISLQAYWIRIKIEQTAQEFDRRVYRSLSKTGKEIEEIEAHVFVNSFKSKPPTKIIRTQKLSETKSKSSHSEEEEYKFIIKVDSLNDIGIKTDQVINFSRSGQTQALTINGEDINLEFLEIHDSTPRKQKQLIKVFEKKKERIETVIHQLAVDFVYQKSSLNERLEDIKLDSIIGKNLKSEGIVGNNFTFEVIDNESDSIIINNDSNQFKIKRTYSTTILKDNEEESGGTINLSFENKTDYILNSIWVSISISILLTLIMIFTFGYTIHSIIKEKKLSKIKADFINNMTHEFKTPIATISLAVDSMLHPLVKKDEKEIEKFGSIIKKENLRMNRQIESVLNAARFEKEEIVFKTEKVSIHSMLNEIHEDFKLKINDELGDIKLDLNANFDQIIADRMHLYNVFSNLIENAIKFSISSFRINIKTTIENQYLSIEISDKGIGMDKETRKRAFDRFYRKTEGNIHTTKGFGLGLNYVKGAVEEMGGTITLSSKLNVGTSFKLLFPLIK